MSTNGPERGSVARFVISRRRSGVAAGRQDARSTLARVQDAFSAQGDEAPPLRKQSNSARGYVHLETTPEDIERRRDSWGTDVWVEVEALRQPAVFTVEALAEKAAVGTSNQAGVGALFRLNVRGDGNGLPHAEVRLFLRQRTSTKMLSLTRPSGDDGLAQFAYDPAAWIPTLAAVEPANRYWGWMVHSPVDGMNVDIPPLPKDGPLAWWHRLLGISTSDLQRGQGIKIGVVDTGIAPNGYLSAIQRRGAVILGNYDASEKATDDEQGHGTHVSGILGARPVEGSGEYEGIAPGAEIAVIRVFPKEGGANQGDIAEAIDILSEEFGADLINLSLGSGTPSAIEMDAIQSAAENGTLCIAAAGNEFGTTLLYPAGYPQTAAVAALGVVGAAPTGSIAASSAPTDATRYEAGLYVANFSNTGYGMTCAAPGVGILSTVPPTSVLPVPYASMSGTSMAAPMACGALASVLAHDTQYLELPRGTERAARASLVFLSSLRQLALNALWVGNGLSQGWPA